MTRSLLRILTALVLVVIWAPAASAAPIVIGLFDWTEVCDDPAEDPPCTTSILLRIFVVTNITDDPSTAADLGTTLVFENVEVLLNGALPGSGIDLGSIDTIQGSAQTSPLVDPVTSATVFFGIDPLLNGQISFPTLTDPGTGDILFTPASIPEPSLLLLFAGGLAARAGATLRRRRLSRRYLHSS